MSITTTVTWDRLKAAPIILTMEMRCAGCYSRVYLYSRPESGWQWHSKNNGRMWRPLWRGIFHSAPHMIANRPGDWSRSCTSQLLEYGMKQWYSLLMDLICLTSCLSMPKHYPTVVLHKYLTFSTSTSDLLFYYCLTESSGIRFGIISKRRFGKTAKKTPEKIR